MCGKERDGKKLYFWSGKEREGKGREKMYFGLGGKWEGQNEFSQCGKEKGRKYFVLLVWDGNGKEILCTVGMGRKC